MRIQLPESVQSVGADRWILYDIADCELHAFVDTDAHKNVQRFYWIQFEGYVPSKPDLRIGTIRHATPKSAASILCGYLGANER